MNKKIVSLFLILILLISSLVVIYQPENTPNHGKVKVLIPLQNFSSIKNKSGVDPWSLMANPCIVYRPASSFPSQEPPFFASQIMQAYNITPLHNEGYTGQGLTVAIVDAYGDPYLNYDISSFNAYEGLPSANISVIYPFSLPTTYNLSWAIETSTDVEWFHAIAPAAKIDLVVVPNAAVGYLQAGINYTIQNLSVNEISLSWGIPESELGQSLVDSYNAAFMEGVDKGIGIFAASGDAGAFDGQKTPTVNFPAADPYVTSVGGTSLYLMDGKYGEYAWSGSGGGYSDYFSNPAYQVAPGFSATNLGVPDMSMDANPNVGGVRVFAGAGCYVIGGTSLATPMSAGSAILISQSLHRNIGFLAPYLYRIANTNQYGRAIVPVSDGSNGFYRADTQWNPVTGLGSMNVALLASDIGKLTGNYGGSAYYGLVRNSSFTISANVNTSVGSISQSESGTIGIGVFSNISGSQAISAGIRENNSGSYFFANVGNQTNFFRLVPGNQYINNTISIAFNISKVRISDGKVSFSYVVFPYDIYGSVFNSFEYVSSGNYDKPIAINASISNYKIASGGAASKEMASIGTFSIAPFSQGNLSTVGVKANAFRVTFSNSSNTPQETYPVVPQIFRILQTYPAVLNFSTKTSFTLNSLPYLGDSVNLGSGDSYVLEYTWKGVNEEFNISVPSYSQQDISLIYNSSWYFMGNFSGTLDYLSPILTGNSLDFSRIGIDSNLTLSSFGFYPFSSAVPGRQSSIQLTEKEVNVSINISPADSRITALGKNRTFEYPYLESLIPESYNLSISAGGFHTSNVAIKLNPGKDIIYAPYTLRGNGNGYFVNGTITNEFYSALDDISVPIRGAMIQYNSTDYAYTDINGQFSIWVPAGHDRLSFSSPYFQNYTYAVNVTGNMDLNESLYPVDHTLSKFPPQVSITRVIPLLFFTSYISWRTNIAKDIKYFIINYRPSGQKSWNQLKINSNTTDYSFLNGIYPWVNYKIMVSAELKDNISINSTIQTLSYSNPVFPLLNSLIYLGIILYIYVVINYFRKKKKRKQMEKSFFEG
ncbi:MAG: S8 family serine peptidase [Candidatus Thermoplasmatota archaeon]|jgi:subtilase family serine protease|nr:S8 family serine peptidase [Candidatus Thermoplasmatota archaeon]